MDLTRTRFVVELTEAEHAALDAERARRGLRSKAEVIRAVINHWQRPDETFDEWSVRVGIKLPEEPVPGWRHGLPRRESERREMTISACLVLGALFTLLASRLFR